LDSDRQKVIVSVQELAAHNEGTASVSDYLAWRAAHPDAGLPGLTKLYHMFYTFYNVLEAAGVESDPRARYRKGKQDMLDDIAYARAWLGRETLSTTEYDDFRHSHPTRFGTDKLGNLRTIGLTSSSGIRKWLGPGLGQPRNKLEDAKLRQKVIISVQELASHNEEHASVFDYLVWRAAHPDAGLPGRTALYRLFRTFYAVLDAAGVESDPRARYRKGAR
jgi:hypothetical protein